MGIQKDLLALTWVAPDKMLTRALRPHTELFQRASSTANDGHGRTPQSTFCFHSGFGIATDEYTWAVYAQLQFRISDISTHC